MSLLVPLLILCIGGVPFPGGAVYIQTSNLASANWESWVSFCGPLANMCCAVLFAGVYLCLRQLTHTVLVDTQTLPALALLVWFQWVAVALNLLPLPPLDGWGMLSPQLSSSCWLKKLLESPWNSRTVQLIVLALLIVVLPRIWIFYEAVRWMCVCCGIRQADLDAGRRIFFGVFSKLSFLPTN
eukprot:GHVS01022332.1.p1 GENE.GHVS01022332.1~~GHVS01022332.1.p1  ORF type:complete len:184 (+),score=25.24 GHVS01022332.1:283-834(+)